jgi:TrmH family RNA methyltransferase
VLERLRVVLVAPRNPLNIGAAARAMRNFGVARLRLVNPYEVAFREARSAVASAAILEAAEEFPSVAEAVADCSLVVGTTAVGHRDLRHPLRRLESGAGLIRAHLAKGPAALLFGSEKFGLSNQDLSHCHWLMRIPIVDRNLSMNLGQAVAVCLYELRRDFKAAVKELERAGGASAEDIERITALLIDLLESSGYINPVTAASGREKVRRLVRRLNIQAGDARVWLGILRQLSWKLSEKKE